jgi:hypothetical protein
MWKIYHTNELNFIETMQSIEDWKQSVFNKMDLKVKKYFAKKMVSHFDNRMIFQQDKSSHENLMEALSDSEKQMIEIDLLFPSIKFYWMVNQDDSTSFIITKGLPEDFAFYPEPKHNLIAYQENPNFNTDKIYEMEHKSWSTLVFDINICNYSKGWINYVPSLEERCAIQTQEILMNTVLKNENLTLLEKVELEENITNNKSYQELYKKISKIMPNINKSLVSEWREAVVSGTVSQTFRKKI